MQLFISSLIGGYEKERAAVAHAASVLRWQVLRAEEFGALRDTPQQACLEAVRQADAVALLLGARYGVRQNSGLSATHEEWREAVRVHNPVLVFVEDVADRDVDQEQFVNEVQDWAAGRFRESFTSPDELDDKVTRALADLASPGPSDESEMRTRALTAIPAETSGLGGRGPRLWVAVSGGPHQQVLRPTEIEAPQLLDALQQEAMFGADGPLDRRAATEPRSGGSGLRLVQADAEVGITEDGTVTICLPTAPGHAGWRSGIPSIIEEDLHGNIASALRFAHAVLGHIDPMHRITDVVPAVALRNAASTPWRTREEAAANPNTVSMPMLSGDDQPVARAPALIRRAALVHDAHRLAEDLTVLLRRQRGEYGRRHS